MSHSDYIQKLLDFQASDITFLEDVPPVKEFIKGRWCLVVEAILSPTLRVCKDCGSISGLIRHGYKKQMIQINKVNGNVTFLRLHK